jgi:hypothetical protein
VQFSKHRVNDRKSARQCRLNTSRRGHLAGPLEANRCMDRATHCKRSYHSSRLYRRQKLQVLRIASQYKHIREMAAYVRFN